MLTMIAVALVLGTLGAPSPWQDDAELQAGCDKGVAADCTTLGLGRGSYLAGKPTQGDLALFTRGCDLGDGRSCWVLATAYESGEAVPRDHGRAKAFEGRAAALFQMGCAAGSAKDCMSGAAAHHNVTAWRSRRADLEKVTRYHIRACELGDPGGCYSAAFDLDQGRAVPVDRARAGEFWRRAAAGYEKGCETNPEVCDVLGEMYQPGGGLPVDFAKALAWTEKGCALEKKTGAANTSLCDDLARLQRDLRRKGTPSPQLVGLEKDCAAGKARACAALSHMLESGFGVEVVDPDRARRLLSEHCAGEKIELCLELADLEARRHDFEAALTSLEKACTGVDAESCRSVANKLRSGSWGLKDDPAREAKAWNRYDALRQPMLQAQDAACEKGLAKDCFERGKAWDPRWQQEGRGDGKKMVAYLERACDLKLAQSCRWLADLYDDGALHLGRDSAKALSYSQKACDAGDRQTCAKAMPAPSLPKS
jgi:TPR repeat protein